MLYEPPEDCISPSVGLNLSAWGDHIMASIVYPVLKTDGYHVAVSSSEKGLDIIKNNPYIDKVIKYKSDTIAAENLEEYYENVGKGYDKFINLNGSIESALLISDKDPDRAGWSQEKKHKEFNVNYYDHTLEVAGYPEIKGKNGELYFSSFEEKLARQFRSKYKNKFIILWSLSGSSMHKSWPYSHDVAIRFLNEHPDAMTLTVGDEICRLIEWEHPRAKCYSGNRGIRQVLIMAKYADLVISTETAVAHGAGCFETPKIILLSHSSPENLTKHWENCIPLWADVDCMPCHMLHYQLGSCMLDEQIGTPICMTKLKPEVVYDAMEEVYQEWKKKTT